jgi:hypothetical protein
MKKGLSVEHNERIVSSNHLVSIGKNLKEYTREQALKIIRENQTRYLDKIESLNNNKR